MIEPAQTKQSPLNEIVQEIVRVAEPDRVILFGSRAKGTASVESDYDFLVVVPSVQNERQVSRLIYRALLEKRMGVAVDAIVVSEETLKQFRASPYFIYRQALAEGQTLYERN
ncbi:MAG: nucleotidyltransferase domain-containing protein [Chloroflexi bacterium]|nr:nucleotidyltransferase domain-containing protein [Chloroflexota bacterium]